MDNPDKLYERNLQTAVRNLLDKVAGIRLADNGVVTRAQHNAEVKKIQESFIPYFTGIGEMSIGPNPA